MERSVRGGQFASHSTKLSSQAMTARTNIVEQLGALGLCHHQIGPVGTARTQDECPEHRDPLTALIERDMRDAVTQRWPQCLMAAECRKIVASVLADFDVRSTL